MKKTFVFFLSLFLFISFSQAQINLDVEGDATVSGKTSLGTNLQRAQLTLRADDDREFGPSIFMYGNSSDQFESGRIRFVEGTVATNWRGAYIHYDGQGNRFHIGTHNVGDSLQVNDVNALTINRGNRFVGIGTETPNAPLHINSNSSSTSPLLRISANNNSKLSLLQNSNGQARLEFEDNDDNIFIGEDTGLSNDTGNDNIFIGRKAGDSNTTGDENIFIGTLAGQNCVGGRQNIYIGHTAGALNFSNGSNPTGSNSGNIFIGTGAGVPGSNYNEKFVLQHYDGSSAGFPNPLLYGDFAALQLAVNWDLSPAQGQTTIPATFSVNGTASKTTAGSWLANSDSRLKKNIQPLSSEKMLNKVLDMQGVTYEWNDTKTGFERPEGTQMGFIAQELQQVFPEKIIEDPHGYLMTAYGDYDPVFVEAIKALNQKIENLEDIVEQQAKIITTLNSQQSEIQALKAQLKK